MKKIAGLLLCGIVLLNSFTSWAQSYAESALLYSRVLPAGSARIQGLGGTQVSLGGDYSSAGSNPAGLGMFNKSEFTFSPGINFGSSTSQFYTQPGGSSVSATGASKSAFEIPGISIALHKNYNKDFDDEKKTFIGGTFAITVSRTNDFNRSFSYDGDNSKTSLVDYFVQNASSNGNVSQFNPPDPNTGLGQGYNYGYPTFLAYDTYLIDSTSNSTRSKNPYYSVLSTDPTNPNDTRTVHQHENVNISGGQNQANLAYGVNILDKIFVGGGLGFSFMNYTSAKVITESDYRFGLSSSHGDYVTSVTLGENLHSSGVGFNANFGVIARPVDFIQIGLSYNSPTYYSLHDTYSAYLTPNYSQNFNSTYYGYPQPGTALGGPQPDYGPPILTQQYNLTTPARINFGATVFILKQGFISADVEKVNYPGAKYSSGSSGLDFSGDNSEIKATVQSTFNYRAGAEYRYKNYRVRAGYSFMPTPYVSTQYSYGVKQDITSISGGLGYRTNKFYIDFAYVIRQTNSGYIPYSTVDYNNLTDNSPKVTTKTTANFVMVTVGFTIKRR